MRSRFLAKLVSNRKVHTFLAPFRRSASDGQEMVPAYFCGRLYSSSSFPRSHARGSRLACLHFRAAFPQSSVAVTQRHFLDVPCVVRQSAIDVFDGF